MALLMKGKRGNIKYVVTTTPKEWQNFKLALGSHLGGHLYALQNQVSPLRIAMQWRSKIFYKHSPINMIYYTDWEKWETGTKWNRKDLHSTSLLSNRLPWAYAEVNMTADLHKNNYDLIWCPLATAELLALSATVSYHRRQGEVKQLKDKARHWCNLYN